MAKKFAMSDARRKMLNEDLKSLGWSKTYLAGMLSESRQNIHHLFYGKHLSLALLERVAKQLGQPISRYVRVK